MDITELRKKLLQQRELLQVFNYELSLKIRVSENVLYRFLDQNSDNLKSSTLKILEDWVTKQESENIKVTSVMLNSLRVIYHEAMWYEETYGKQEIFSKIIKMCKNAGV